MGEGLMMKIKAVLLSVICGLTIASCVSNNAFNSEQITGAVQPVQQRVQETAQATDEYLFRSNAYHNFEQHGDRIYALYRRSDQEIEWTDELWCFSPNDDRKLIAQGQGLDFRVSSNNAWIAVELDNVIHILNTDGAKITTIEKPEHYRGYYDIQLEQWSRDATTLWYCLNETFVTVAYVAVDTNTWEQTSYEDMEFKTQEYSLNPNTGWVVYSDYPVMLDIIAFEQYMDSERMTTLRLYNLATQERIMVDAAMTNMFQPQWVDDNEMIYYIGSERKTYIINDKQ